MEMRIAMLFLIVASSFQSIGCAGIREKDGSNCYSLSSREGYPVWALRLELSAELVCTDLETRVKYTRLMKEFIGQIPGYAYRDVKGVQLDGRSCTSLRNMAGLEYREDGERDGQGLVTFSSEHQALVSKSEDPAINLGAKEVPLKLEQLLQLELNSGCEAYRQREAALAAAENAAKKKRKEEQEIQAAQWAKFNAKKEAKRKLEEERQAQWDRQRQKQIARICPKGLGDLGELIFANPYDVKGRCYGFAGRTLQILSRSTGFYQLNRSDRVYIDFGRDAAPGQLFQGYVKGVGVFSYTTVVGAKMIVPSLVVTELPPEEYPARAAD